ncbi:MAG: DUF4190 domain-containing protein [Bacteroidetes bacterium]|nr:DUF4190 domain-containing protein [Bacteroidota bacterium]
MQFKLFLSIFILSVALFSCKAFHPKPSQSAYGGSFGRVDITHTDSAENPVSNSTNYLEGGISDVQSLSISSVAGNYPNRIVRHWKRLSPVLDSIKKRPPPAKNLPIEPNANIGFLLSVIGGALNFILPFLNLFIDASVSFESLYILFFMLNVLAFIAMIAGFILGITGLKMIKRYPEKYSGYGRAVAAIVIPSVIVGLFLLLVIFYILIIILLLQGF